MPNAATSPEVWCRMIARSASRLSSSCRAMVAGFVLSICRVFRSRCRGADRGKEVLDQIRAGCRVLTRTCTIGKDVRLPPDPEVPRPVGIECSNFGGDTRDAAVLRAPIERLGAERAAARCPMGAAPCGLELAHHVRVIRVLFNDPAPRNAPRIGAGVIERADRHRRH